MAINAWNNMNQEERNSVRVDLEALMVARKAEQCPWQHPCLPEKGLSVSCLSPVSSAWLSPQNITPRELLLTQGPSTPLPEPPPKDKHVQVCMCK